MTTTAPSWQDLYNEAKTELLARRPDLNVFDGDISDMLMAAISAVGDRLIGYTAQRVKATFLDGAVGDDLTTLAADHWNINRQEAVQAIGTVTFSRASAGAGAGVVAAGTVVATIRDAFGNDVQFTTDNDVNFTIAALGPLSTTVTAVVAGLSGNVAAGAVNRVVSTLFDSSITVTNAAVTVGGAEEESDEDLRARVRNFSTTLRRGTLAALEYGALQVETVAQATAVEDEDTGMVTVYVTDASGASNAAMVADVMAELEDWRAAGSLVNVTGGQLYELNPIEIVLTVRSGVDTAAIAADVKSAIVARVARLKIGETCRREIIQQAALNVDPDNITGCTVTLPAADVEPDANEVVRTDTSYITVA
jgi:hypothetical protein